MKKLLQQTLVLVKEDLFLYTCVLGAVLLDFYHAWEHPEKGFHPYILGFLSAIGLYLFMVCSVRALINLWGSHTPLCTFKDFKLPFFFIATMCMELLFFVFGMHLHW